MRPSAYVMNMFYTGLGIARSLGEHGIPVVGLTAQRGFYGNYTRYAKAVFSPDSRHEPEALLTHLVRIGQQQEQQGIIFPTRDDDLIFLDRFRSELAPYFIPAIPQSSVLHDCLDKWRTYSWAQRAAVATPKCWMIEGEQDLRRSLHDLTYPCVLKPVSAHHWRKANNWEVVGGRKAVPVFSERQLLAEYGATSRADERVLLQEMIPGDDKCLLITACYLDQRSNWVAGFNTQKLVQAPEGFGTGCIVQAAERTELFEPALRLLQKMQFTGIAEVEFKWHEAKSCYQLIEVNPRPWDQHRLGKTCGTDLVYLAYCEHAGLPLPAVTKRASAVKWVAEDTFFLTALQMAWKRDPKLASLFRLARGKRIYAIWSAKDPLPLVAYLLRFIPTLIGTVARSLWSAIKRKFRSRQVPITSAGQVYEGTLEKRNSHG